MLLREAPGGFRSPSSREFSRVPTSLGPDPTLHFRVHAAPGPQCELRGQAHSIIPWRQVGPFGARVERPGSSQQTQVPGPPLWTQAPGLPLWREHQAGPEVPTTRPDHLLAQAPGLLAQGLQQPVDTSRISGGLSGEGVCLLKPVRKDWKRYLHPQMCRHQ